MEYDDDQALAEILVVLAPDDWEGTVQDFREIIAAEFGDEPLDLDKLQKALLRPR